MPLFTPAQLSLLQDIAASRVEQLEMEALQPYADYLYDIVVEDITRDKDLIFSDLFKATHKTTNPERITIPFWRFVSCFTASEPVGTDRNDSYLGVSETSFSGWRNQMTTDWVLPPVSMDRLFRMTDLCTRLALFLGEENFCVGFVPIDEDEDAECHTNDVVITFFPHGVGPEQLARIEAVKTKYHSYYTPRPLGENEVIERSGEAGRPPRTPEFGPASVPARPPPLRRMGAIVADEEDEEDEEDDNATLEADSPVSPPCFCQTCVGPLDM